MSDAFLFIYEEENQAPAQVGSTEPDSRNLGSFHHSEVVVFIISKVEDSSARNRNQFT
ncbi:hypothetical protein PIL02S_05978 [Paenibacillus illinoisensis]|uniref:Uncharacterized protein n=1 Tax=Paenibacillus illinoisensis TaxID=59845 RepID=A0A2W0CFF7_9BACL|nr:hypothetical protein PIL02S_05978 [Paenibacillus illinoisensis]